MFLIIPTGTDAPIYHIPFGTFGMIAVNIVVFVLQTTFPEINETFILDFGSWNPIQWLTSAVMHADPIHLISNMVIFAFCGWIIEGKIGWWRFIVIYFLIAAIEGFIVQTVMLLFGGSGALGASGVIFGMIAIVMIWAPENEISFFGFILIFLYPITFSFSATILIVSFFLLALELLNAAWVQFQMSSAMLHLVGAMPGAVIGYMMVKLRWVDCEGYDLISFINGDRGKRKLTVQQEQELKREKARQIEEANQELEVSTSKIDFYLQKGHYELALNRYVMHRRRDKRFQISEAQMLAIISGMWAMPDKQEKVIPLMEIYLQTYGSQRVAVNLNLAHFVLTKRQQPKKCLQILKKVTSDPMTPQQTDYARKLIAHAQKLIQDGVIDFVE